MGLIGHISLGGDDMHRWLDVNGRHRHNPSINAIGPHRSFAASSTGLTESGSGGEAIGLVFTTVSGARMTVIHSITPSVRGHIVAGVWL